MLGILLDENYDLIIENGTLKVGDVDEQITEWVMKTNKGDLKENPIIGVGITKKLNGPIDPMLENEIKEQLELQHIVATVRVNGSEIQIN